MAGVEWSSDAVSVFLRDKCGSVDWVRSSCCFLGASHSEMIPNQAWNRISVLYRFSGFKPTDNDIYRLEFELRHLSQFSESMKELNGLVVIKQSTRKMLTDIYYLASDRRLESYFNPLQHC